MRKKAAALLLVGVSMATWVSCGKSVSHYVYAALPTPSQIVAYRKDPNSGVMTALSGSPFTAGSGVQAIMIHPSRKFLYAANSGEGDISLFTIDATGALTESPPRATAGITPTLLAMDSGGNYLYVGNAGSNTIWTFSIDASLGRLTAVGSPFLTGASPLNMALSPSGNFLYVTIAGSPGSVEVIGLVAGIPTTFGPLAQVGNNPYGLVIDPSGAHLYVANSAPDNSISEFTINSDGSLQPLSGSPIGETFTSPVALLVDNSGKYLYVANKSSGNLGAYAIGSDGGLTVLTNSPFGTNTSPTFIASDPGGRYLFVGNQASSATIQVFSLDPGSGTLTSVGSYSAGGAPTSIVVIP